MDPNTAYPAGFPVPSQSPNPMSFYPNNFPQQLAQSKGPVQPGQQHSFGAMPMQPGAGGAIMPQTFPQSTASMDNFSAPFSQQSAPPNMNQFSQPNTSMNIPSTVAQTFSQNMASISANNLLANQSRTQLNSPKVAQPGTPKQNQNQSQGHNTGPSQNPAQGPSQVQLQAQAQVLAREKIRVITLLDINSTLLQEITNLQAAGKAGSSTQPDGTNGNQVAQKPSQEYIDCMRRLQANLAYLASITDKQRRLPAPAILTPPPNTPTLNDMYKKLNDLFPRPGQGSTPQRASPGMVQGNGGPSPSPLPDPIV